MATSSKGKVNYESSSGNIEFDLEATNMQLGSDEYAIRTIDDRDSNTYEANNRVGDCATRTVEDHDQNTYESLEEPYMNANLGESPNEENDTKPGERKVRTTMTRSPNRWMCMFAAVILLLVIGISVFLVVYFTSKENSEESIRCPQYTDIENGKVVNTTGSKHGDVIGIKCDERNKLVGPKSITCLSSGKWSSTPKCIPKNCDDFVIPNNMIMESETNGSHVGTEMFVSCTDGFKLHGKKTIICQLNESWSDIPTCKAIDCGVPGNIANAEVFGLFKTTYNSTIYVECNEGYKPKGSNIIRCTASGVWDELPTCEMVSCGIPDIPTHASISDITGTSFQATVTFKCDEGFYLRGNSVTRCQSNGLWTKDSTCKNIDDCTSSHCGNGTCVDGINSYTCACSKGFTGKSCERRLPTDCFDLYNFDGKRTDGVYTIVTWKTHQSIQVYCDMATDGGGWTVFQYRFNGSVNFYRNFTEYEHGFGNLNTEFWLGLNYIQEVSDQGQTDLRIDLESASGTRAFEKFENFYLSSGPNFTLHVGQTTDSLHISSKYRRFGPYHNGMRFTTYDRDVDSVDGNCAVYYYGAWWYRGCYTADLNGPYRTPGTRYYASMRYHSFIFKTALKSSRMMIRRN